MSTAAIIVLAVIGLTVLLLATTRISADAVLMAALTFLLVVPTPTPAGWQIGVMSAKDALAGFSNEGLATVAVLFVLVAGLRETGGIDWIATRLLGKPRSLRGAIARVIGPVWGLSIFLNNTPVVAMLIPAINDWARRLKLPPSKLLIPLSYAAILGGTCSLIGTSTNLVVNGMLISETGGAYASLSMFDITWIGLPCAIIGFIYLILVAPRLLPTRGSAAEILSDPREYLLELVVPVGSPLNNQSVEQAGLRNLPGCYLVDIERDGMPLGSVDPSQVIRAGDRLLFAGVVDAIRDLQKLRGLVPATDQVFKLQSPRYRRRLFEAVLSDASPVVNRSVREGRFRTRYQGVILAVARGGKRLAGKVGDIELRAGDTLLIEADAGFADRFRNTRAFLLVSPLSDSTPRRHTRAPIAIVILTAMILIATFNWLSMLLAAMLAAGFMLISRCCSVSEARRSVDWSVLVVIGAALGLGRAMDQSGAALAITSALLSIAGDNPWMALAAIYLCTAFITEIITNNGAVALTFPIAYSTATQLDVNFLPFAFAIMMAGSASFATPIGYQCNLLIYGPGGYNFADFLKVGIPMNILMAITSITLIPLIWPF